MAFPLTAFNTAPRRFFIFPAVLLISFLLIFSNGFITAAESTCSVPKRWEDFNAKNPMKIGVRDGPGFHMFVKKNESEDPKDKTDDYTGFSIDVFKEIVEILKKKHPRFDYEFVPCNCSNNDELVTQVSDKISDAAIGDVSILFNRSKYVDFTQPYMESELALIVPVKSKEKTWKFLEPFTMTMWVVTFAILIYTMFIVLVLEQGSNPAFRGSWKNQLGTSLWFTFSSLFFAHREKIHSNYTRVVLTVWLFIVLILTSSYTANLSSMLTAKRLEPNTADIQWLKKNNATVGCGIASFSKNYLKDELKFQPENIKLLRTQQDYESAFKNNTITAALLEVESGKLLIKGQCKIYTFSETVHEKRGGLGFVFPKGSPLTANVSQAILALVEKGRLKDLEDKLFQPFIKCSNGTAIETASLSLKSFLGLYATFLATSILCVLLFLFQLLLKKYRDRWSNLRISPSSGV
ncbi:hypothetical protein L1049_021499 [Liquidambar formosana]|uniref:Ionotropic glutamate receptor C-terminal domain-containing protein n=1 Tax=Liquidambar formosana TaxID=63359 RepID=A0AAP0N1Q9_LIQFO